MWNFSFCHRLSVCPAFFAWIVQCLFGKDFKALRGFPVSPILLSDCDICLWHAGSVRAGDCCGNQYFSLRMVFSLFSPLQAELQNKQVSSAYRATELSIYALIMDCVGIATNLSFGWLADQNLSLAFWFGFFCVCSVFLLFADGIIPQNKTVSCTKIKIRRNKFDGFFVVLCLS